MTPVNAKAELAVALLLVNVVAEAVDSVSAVPRIEEPEPVELLTKLVGTVAKVMVPVTAAAPLPDPLKRTALVAVAEIALLMSRLLMPLLLTTRLLPAPRVMPPVVNCVNPMPDEALLMVKF